MNGSICDNVVSNGGYVLQRSPHPRLRHVLGNIQTSTWRRDDDSDHVEYQSCDRQSKEGTDEARHPYVDVPHAEVATVGT